MDATLFIYYLRGKDEIRIGDSRLIATEDTVRIQPVIKISDPAITCRTLEDAEYLVIAYYSATPITYKHTVTDVSSDPEIKELFRKLRKVWVDKYGDYLIKSAQIFWKIIEKLEKISASYNETHTNRINASVEYIHMHYTEPDFSCTALPGICGLKQTRFIESFSKQTGMSPKKYLTKLRLERAGELLTFESATVFDAANKSGFESPGYFSKIFKNYYKMTPGEYKRQYQASIRA